MAILVWAMMGLAIWHFTIFLPDNFWAGIIGAFIGALLGAILFGLVVNLFDVPSREDVDLITALEAVPGACLGIAIAYFAGLRREMAHAH